MKQSGIYRIVNKINGKGYVGKSKHIPGRWKEHRVTLRHNRHHSNHLQAAWNKYGEKAFNFEILEIVSNSTDKLLTQREQYWINFYDAANSEKGYNISPTAGSNAGLEHEQTKIHKKQILEFCKKNGYKPVHDADDLEESKLGTALHNYVAENSSSYDINFKQEVIKYPTFKELRKKNLIKDILAFTNKFGYLPSRVSKDKTERKLRLTIDGFMCPSTDMYDPEIEKLISGIPTKQYYKTDLIKKQLRKFVVDNGYIPCRTSPGTEEKFLAKRWNLFSAKNQHGFDAELVKYISQFPTWETFKKVDKSERTQKRLNQLYDIRCIVARKLKKTEWHIFNAYQASLKVLLAKKFIKISGVN